MTTEAEKTDNTAPDFTTRPAKVTLMQRHAAVFEGAPMRDLITCSRLFCAAMNTEVERFSDDDMAVLGDFDGFLAEAIAKRRPQTAEEFAAKTHYLLCRVEDGNLTDAADEAIMEAIKADAAELARLSPEVQA